MSNHIVKNFDIIINGGGIVGFTVLNSILKSSYLRSLRVLLIEQSSRPSDLAQPERQLSHGAATDISNKTYSNRVSSITRSTRETFENTGVWHRVESFAKDVEQIQVWNYDSAHKITFKQPQLDRQSSKSNVVFSVVENNRLSLALLKSISEVDQNFDSIVWNSSLQALSDDQATNNICVDAVDKKSGQNFQAKAPLILGCDGFKSKVREIAEMRYYELDLNRTAIVGTVEMTTKSDNLQKNCVAYQRFSAEKDTVAALLPLCDRYSSFVISAPKEYSRQLLENDDDSFIDEFNRLLRMKESPQNQIINTAHKVAESLCNSISMYVNRSNLSTHVDEAPELKSVVANSRAGFPLFFGTTSPKMTATFAGRKEPQIALLGDSTHRVHPLAGQGLNLGIQDAVELVRQLEDIVKCGERLSNLTLLSKSLMRYQIKRQAIVLPMSAGILSMQGLFKLMPSTLLSTIDRLPFIKSTSVRFAS